MNDVMKVYAAKHYLIVIIQICAVFLYLFQDICLFIENNAECLLSIFLTQT